MQDSLHDHIVFLEQQVQELSDMLTRRRVLPAERDRIAREIQRASIALEHYRRASEIEQKLKTRSPN